MVEWRRRFGGDNAVTAMGVKMDQPIAEKLARRSGPVIIRRGMFQDRADPGNQHFVAGLPCEAVGFAEFMGLFGAAP